MLKESVTVFNPQIFVNGSLLNLGLDIYSWGVLLVSLAILITVSTIQYRMENSEGEYHSVRELIASKGIVLRWIILFALLFYCIFLAEYGPGYSAAEFIYKDF